MLESEGLFEGVEDCKKGTYDPVLPIRELHIRELCGEVGGHERDGHEEDGGFGEEEGDACEALDGEGFFDGDEVEVLNRQEISFAVLSPCLSSHGFCHRKVNLENICVPSSSTTPSTPSTPESHSAHTAVCDTSASQTEPAPPS